MDLDETQKQADSCADGQTDTDGVDGRTTYFFTKFV